MDPIDGALLLEQRHIKMELEAIKHKLGEMAIAKWANLPNYRISRKKISIRNAKSLIPNRKVFTHWCWINKHGRVNFIVGNRDLRSLGTKLQWRKAWSRAYLWIGIWARNMEYIHPRQLFNIFILFVFLSTCFLALMCRKKIIVNNILNWIQTLRFILFFPKNSYLMSGDASITRGQVWKVAKSGIGFSRLLNSRNIRIPFPCHPDAVCTRWIILCTSVPYNGATCSYRTWSVRSQMRPSNENNNKNKYPKLGLLPLK